MSWLASPAHHRWLEAEGDRLLSFSRASRHPAGGFAWLSSDGTPDLDRPVELWITCRMTHVFALGQLMGRPGCAPLVDHGVAALRGRFHDPSHSGWYAGLAADGPTTRAKTAYEHAFVVLASASASCAERPGAAVLLDDALDVLLNRFWDDEHFDSSWKPLLSYNIDTPAHPFRPYGATVGHWLEWARLALHLRAALGSSAPSWLLTDAIALFEAAVNEGWAVDGADGFVYTVDWSGKPVVRERMHWVAAEATATAAALHKATGEPSYADWYELWWDHIADVFIDRRLGSWRHELDASNRPSGVVWNGKPDTYHAFQATLLPRLPLAPTLATALREGLLT